MNKVELSSFRSEIEKKAFVGRALKRMFLSKKKIPRGERALNVGSSLLGTTAIVGALGGGGLAYGALTQPRSIRSTHPARFR